MMTPDQQAGDAPEHRGNDAGFDDAVFVARDEQREERPRDKNHKNAGSKEHFVSQSAAIQCIRHSHF
jgi:hypothetical protein